MSCSSHFFSLGWVGDWFVCVFACFCFVCGFVLGVFVCFWFFGGFLGLVVVVAVFGVGLFFFFVCLLSDGSCSSLLSL